MRFKMRMVVDLGCGSLVTPRQKWLHWNEGAEILNGLHLREKGEERGQQIQKTLKQFCYKRGRNKVAAKWKWSRILFFKIKEVKMLVMIQQRGEFTGVIFYKADRALLQTMWLRWCKIYHKRKGIHRRKT